MAFDLALSEHNDLIFAGNRDFQGVSGGELVEQRIRLRIKMQRGSWVYDTPQNLGSNVHQSLGKTFEQAISEIQVFVRQALENMEDIQIQGIQLRQPTEDGRLAEIVIGYAIIEPPGESVEEAPESEVNELAIEIPVEG